jgi:hypothetical protein
VDSRHRGAEDEMYPGLKTVPVGRRRLRHDEEEISLRYRTYRVLRRTLQKEIKIAKYHAWSDLIEAIESNPQGRPYRTVTQKLRTKGPLATAEMEQALLVKVIGTLFLLQEEKESYIPADMPTGRGRQASRESRRLPFGATHFRAGAGLARKPIRLPERTLDE